MPKANFKVIFCQWEKHTTVFTETELFIDLTEAVEPKTMRTFRNPQTNPKALAYECGELDYEFSSTGLDVTNVLSRSGDTLSFTTEFMQNITYSLTVNVMAKYPNGYDVASDVIATQTISVTGIKCDNGPLRLTPSASNLVFQLGLDTSRVIQWWHAPDDADARCEFT